jgi:Spy/CpxP family protein refolding chaperone
MRKSYILYPAIALALIVAASVTAAAQRPGGPGRGDRPGLESADGRGPGPGRFGGRGAVFAGVTRNLDLTPEQRTKMQGIVDGVRVKVEPLADELRVSQRALRAEMFADTKDESKIAGLSARVQTLNKQIADIRLESTSAIASVLTAEQRERVRTATGREPDAARGGPGGGGPGRGLGRGAGRGPGSVRG